MKEEAAKHCCYRINAIHVASTNPKDKYDIQLDSILYYHELSRCPISISVVLSSVFGRVLLRLCAF